MTTTKISRTYYINSDIYSEPPIYPVNLNIDTINEIVYGFFEISDKAQVISSDTWVDYEKRFTNDKTSTKPLDDYLSENEKYHGCLNQFRKILDGGECKLILGLINTSESNLLFSKIINSDTLRALFLESLLERINFFGIFSGILFNISETTLNSSNLTLFLSELKEKIVVDNNIENFSINLLISGNQTDLQFSEMNEIVDTFEVRCYLYDNIVSDHFTYLYKNSYSDFSIENVLDILTEKTSINKNKILLGLSRDTVMYTNTDGLSHSYSERKSIVFNQELSNYTFKYFWDNITKSVMLYDPVKKVLVVYENENSIYEKCKYVISNDFLGCSLDRYDLQKSEKMNKFLSENCQAPEIQSNYIVFGFWTQKSKEYLVGNIVYHKNCEYICIKDHTSSVVDEPGTEEKWKKMSTDIISEISLKEPSACSECNRKIKNIRIFGEIDFSKVEIIYE
jgi:hypothetical protein